MHFYINHDPAASFCRAENPILRISGGDAHGAAPARENDSGSHGFSEAFLLHGSTVASDWARGLAFFQKVSGTALAHAEILHGGANFLPCGIASAIPWTRHAEKKCFANL
jgi:hypothetical protein